MTQGSGRSGVALFRRCNRTGGMKLHMWKRRPLVGGMAALAAVLLLAACGSTSSAPTGSSAGLSASSRQTRIQAESLRFTRCVRTRGVPNFPDPPNGGGYGLKSFAQQSNGQTLSINGVSVNAQAFRSALADCERYLPQSPPATATALAAYRAQALRYGRCMRRHGIDIPDPKIELGSGGNGIRRQIDIPSGMSQNSPAFVAADEKCQS